MKNRLKLITLAVCFLVFIAGCDSSGDDPTPTPTPIADCSITDFLANNPELVGPGSDTVVWGTDFKTWMQNNNYSDIAGSRGWGGSNSSCTGNVNKTPIIFIHGNGGFAQSFGTPDSINTGDSLKTYLKANGYDDCELYAIQWQPDMTQPVYSENHYKGSRLAWIRHFMQAVLTYTGKTKVNVIGWSMGVNAARKAITGGTAYEDPDRQTACNLGPSLKNSVETYIGLAGATYGSPTCGTWGVDNLSKAPCSANGLSIDSPFLIDLNGGKIGSATGPNTVADYTYSLYSNTDSYMCDEDTNFGNDRWVNKGIDIPACVINSVHISEIPGHTAGRDIDSILDWFDDLQDYHSIDNKWVDHISIAFYNSLHNLVNYILNNSPDQADLDTHYGTL